MAETPPLPPPVPPRRTSPPLPPPVLSESPPLPSEKKQAPAKLSISGLRSFDTKLVVGFVVVLALVVAAVLYSRLHDSSRSDSSPVQHTAAEIQAANTFHVTTSFGKTLDFNTAYSAEDVSNAFPETDHSRGMLVGIDHGHEQYILGARFYKQRVVRFTFTYSREAFSLPSVLKNRLQEQFGKPDSADNPYEDDDPLNKFSWRLNDLSIRCGRELLGADPQYRVMVVVEQVGWEDDLSADEKSEQMKKDKQNLEKGVGF